MQKGNDAYDLNRTYSTNGEGSDCIIDNVSAHDGSDDTSSSSDIGSTRGDISYSRR